MIAFIFIVGLFLGSFLNLAIDRLPRGEGIVNGRSRCDFCKRTLKWYDLFPIFSFIFLKGKCRFCHKFIGWKYPAIEFVTAVTFAICLIVFQGSTILYLCLTLIILSCLIVIFFSDMFSGIIPDGVLVVLGVFSLIRMIIFSGQIPIHIITAALAFLFFLSVFLLTRGKGIGFGDVKYSFIMGLMLGFPNIIPSLYIAFLTGALVASILVLIGKKKMKSTIAFGPFLVLGTVITIFWGNFVWMFFQKLLGI